MKPAMISDTLPSLDLYYTDPAQHVITAGLEVDDLDRDLSGLSVRRVLRSGQSFVLPFRQKMIVMDRL